MHQPKPEQKPPAYKPGRTIDRELLANMGIELADLAREKASCSCPWSVCTLWPTFRGFLMTTMTGSDGYEYETLADRLIGKKADTDFNWHFSQFKDSPKEYSREFAADWSQAYQERQAQGFGAEHCVFSAYKYAIGRTGHSSRTGQPNSVAASSSPLHAAH